MDPAVIRWLITNIVGTQTALLRSKRLDRNGLDSCIELARYEYDAKLGAQTAQELNETAAHNRRVMGESFLGPIADGFAQQVQPEEPPCTRPDPES